MSAALEVRNLTKQYDDVTAVDDLSFEVYEGEIFGLLGPNGSGETTTIRTAMDIFRPDSGEVRVLGKPPGTSRERVGYMPEERGLYDNLKVMEVLVYLACLKGVDGTTARERAGNLLERFGLSGHAADKVNSLSGGLRQKLQFVVCLVHDPDLLILDEPFNALDPMNVALFAEVIRELQTTDSIIAAVPIFFTGIVLANPDATLARVFSFIPLTAPTMMLRIPRAACRRWT